MKKSKAYRDHIIETKFREFRKTGNRKIYESKTQVLKVQKAEESKEGEVNGEADLTHIMSKHKISPKLWEVVKFKKSGIVYHVMRMEKFGIDMKSHLKKNLKKTTFSPYILENNIILKTDQVADLGYVLYDMKQENVLVDDEQNVRIIDFSAKHSVHLSKLSSSSSRYQNATEEQKKLYARFTMIFLLYMSLAKQRGWEVHFKRLRQKMITERLMMQNSFRVDVLDIVKSDPHFSTMWKKYMFTNDKKKQARIMGVRSPVNFYERYIEQERERENLRILKEISKSEQDELEVDFDLPSPAVEKKSKTQHKKKRKDVCVQLFG